MSIDSIYKESIDPELLKIGLKKWAAGTFTLGYVMPENTYKTWDFKLENAYEATRDMAAVEADHGLIFMLAHKDLPAIYEKIEE